MESRRWKHAIERMRCEAAEEPQQLILESGVLLHEQFGKEWQSQVTLPLGSHPLAWALRGHMSFA